MTLDAEEQGAAQLVPRDVPVEPLAQVAQLSLPLVPLLLPQPRVGIKATTLLWPLRESLQAEAAGKLP